MDSDEFELLAQAREQLRANQDKQISFKEDFIICECLCISAKDVREFLEGRELNLDILSKKLRLGTACGSCAKEYNQWKDKI